MQIAALQKVSLIDYPDKICATIFVQGCNFRCPFCYNPELVTNRLSQIITDFHRSQIPQISQIKEGEVFEYLEKRKGMIDGVCVTGGEPTLPALTRRGRQKDLPEFLGKIKEMGFLIKLDTNGSNPEMLKELIEKRLIDYIAMDIKAPLTWEKYKEAIGIENKELFNRVLESMEILLSITALPRRPRRGAPGEDTRGRARKDVPVEEAAYEFRTTVAPGLLDRKDILEIAKQIKGAEKYVLQNFVNNKEMIDPEYKKRKPYGKKILEEMAEEARRFVRKCEICLN